MAEDISRKSTNVVLDPEISSEIISKAIEESFDYQSERHCSKTGSSRYCR